MSSDCGEIIVDILKFCLMKKYEQSQAFREELERSKGLFIVEDQSRFAKSADTYGAKLSDDGNEYSGPNPMSRLLMELRDNGRLDFAFLLNNSISTGIAALEKVDTERWKND